MRIDILTLFPESVDAMLNVSILGRAHERGYIAIATHQIRSYTTNRQMQVDDYPYGGGRGAVMQADPLFRCWEHVRTAFGPGRTIFLSPCGRTFTQEVAKEFYARYDHLILVCGHYEGVDQRFLDECVDEELSLGDFVLTGGEIPAMAVCDAVCRMVPGVLPDETCFTEESHWNGLLEYPQYSRPEEWHGRRVPPVLLSGDHAKVDAWRKKESYKRTMVRRPDLFARFDETQLTTKAQRRILQQAKDELAAGDGAGDGEAPSAPEK
jgi:tRNA (guanine37-N1)-methyltransferase